MLLMTDQQTRTTTPSRPAGVQHLVLNVRDLETAHRFWTEIMGFEHVAEMSPESRMRMRFYRGGTPGHHHDIALNEIRHAQEAPAPERWSMGRAQPGLNHLAVQYPDRDSWLNQVAHLQANGVEFLMRGEHGMSHSVYIADPDGHGIEVLYDLPNEVWQDGLNEAFNYFKQLPREGEAALEDSTDVPVFGARS
jgi:catechol 2,3-dioxygenase